MNSSGKPWWKPPVKTPTLQNEGSAAQLPRLDHFARIFGARAKSDGQAPSRDDLAVIIPAGQGLAGPDAPGGKSKPRKRFAHSSPGRVGPGSPPGPSLPNLSPRIGARQSIVPTPLLYVIMTGPCPVPGRRAKRPRGVLEEPPGPSTRFVPSLSAPGGGDVRIPRIIPGKPAVPASRWMESDGNGHALTLGRPGKRGGSGVFLSAVYPPD